MPNFCSSSNPAKPILVRLSVIHSLKKHPHSYAKIEKNLWPPFEKNIGRQTVSDVSATLKVVEVTPTRQRERRLKSNQFD
jgi:hypothetical protein